MNGDDKTINTGESNAEKTNITEVKRMEHFENEAESGIHVMETTTSLVTPHWHNHYEIDFCCDGNGYTILNGKKYPCRRGTFSFVTLSDVYEHKSDGKGCLKFINLNFNFNAISYSVITELLHNFSGFVFQCDDEETIKFENILKQIKYEDENNKPLGKRYIKNLLDNLLIEVYRKKKDFDTLGYDKGKLDKEKYNKINADVKSTFIDSEYAALPHSVQRVVYYVNAHFKEQITLKDVSDYAEIEYTSIGKYIKKYLNVSFKEYLTDIRLTYAKNLLCNTDVTITELAFYCGYSTVTYFISEFKKKYGCSPREYRQNINHT